jgi:hypothetical protein
VKAVAAGNEVAFNFLFLAGVLVPDARMLGVEVGNFDIERFVECGCAARFACSHQIARNFGLTVDDDFLPVGEL